MLLSEACGDFRGRVDMQKFAELDDDAAKHVSGSAARNGGFVGRNGNVRGRMQLAVQDKQMELYGRQSSRVRQYGAGRYVYV